jgi:hypothetical protein
MNFIKRRNYLIMLEFVNSPVVILGLILLIIVAIGFVIAKVAKSKKEFSGTVKHGNTELGIKIGSDSKQNSGEEPVKNEDKISQEYDLDKLTLHRFFTSVLTQYTSDTCIFNLYDETIRL